MAKGSWRDTPEFTHREDHEDPHMRPSIGKLITKLKRLDVLADQPDSVTYINEAIARHYFVHERLRPADAFENFVAAYRVWQAAMGYPPITSDQRNDRQLEMAQNAVTGDALPNSQSLPSPDSTTDVIGIKHNHLLSEGLLEGCPGCEQYRKEPRLLNNLLSGKKPRNNTSPGPSHKSPIAYSNAHVGTGFTIPGIGGRFIWHGDEKTVHAPDMDRVVEVIAAGLGGRSPDLEDKNLMKRVRQIIWDHTFGAVDDSKGRKQVECSCGEEFDMGEEWAKHVRKLIWKELKG